MLLSAVSVLVVAQSSSEIPEELMNNPVLLLFLTTKAVRKVSVHFEYLENRSRVTDVTWQPVRGDLTVHP